MTESLVPQVIEIHPFDPRSDQMGGGIRYVKSFARFLRQIGVGAVVVGVADPEIQTRSDPSRDFRPVYRGLIDWRRFALGLLARLPKLIPEPNALVHVYHPLAVLPFIAWRRSNPIACTILGHTLTSLAPVPVVGPMITRFLTALEAVALRRCFVVTVTGSSTADFILARHPSMGSKVRVTQTGVDRDEFRLIRRSDARARLGWPDGAHVVLFVGRLSPVKNIPLLIDAFEVARSRLPDSQLVVVGDGEDKALFQPLLDRGQVRLEGIVPSMRIPLLMNGANALVVASTSEGSPYVVKEALSCGLYVVSTPVGDATRVLSDARLGEVVDWDATAMGNAIARAIQAPDSEEDRLCRSEAALVFSAQRAYEDLWRLLSIES